MKKNDKKMKNNKNNKNQTNNCTKQAGLCMLKENAAVVLVLRLPGGFLLPKSIAQFNLYIHSKHKTGHG